MRLYKYFNNVVNAMDALERCSFKFTQISECNDLFEMMPTYKKLSTNQIKQILTGQDGFYVAAYRILLNYGFVKSREEYDLRINDDALIGLIVDILYENPEFLFNWHDEVRGNIGICSLTKNSEDLLMWSHYGNKHKGIVIGYEFNTDYWDDKLFPIKYEEERLILDLIETSNWAKEKLVLKYLDRKSCDWKYEQEVRLISNINDCKLEIINGNEIYINCYKHSMIKEVIIGFRLNNEHYKELSTLLSSEKLRHVELKIIQPINNKYKIRAENIVKRYKLAIHKKFRQEHFYEYYLSHGENI